MQALCLFAGANSIFYGERLLTAPNPEADKDQRLFERLGVRSLEDASKHTPPQRIQCQ
ncbi:MAG: biotin synthase BioB, partial [Candidatus Binatia bacterium]